jgi:hypothetical protein
VQSAQNQNAAHGSTSTPACVAQDLKRSVASLELRIHRFRREAMTLVRQDDLLRKRYELLVSIPGIAQACWRTQGSMATERIALDTRAPQGVRFSPFGMTALPYK